MNASKYIGVRLGEAKEALRSEGMENCEVVVTGPPRLTDRTPDDNDRVLRVELSRSPVRILVCKQ